jgi:hypothetical protein
MYFGQATTLLYVWILNDQSNLRAIIAITASVLHTSQKKSSGSKDRHLVNDLS